FGMPKDRRRPFDSMDLGNDRRIDKSCMLKQVVISPLGVFLLQPVADRIVLQREQRVEELEAHPPSHQRSRLQLHQRIWIRMHQMVLADEDLAVYSGSHLRAI